MSGAYKWSSDPTVIGTSALFERTQAAKNTSGGDYQTADAAASTMTSLDWLSADLYDRALQFHVANSSKPVSYSFQFYQDGPCTHVWNSR
jgi:hypothetical protein